MISILILTNDVIGWANKFHCCLHTLRERKTNDGYHLENPLFVVDIENDISKNRKRRRYSHIIIDKPIPYAHLFLIQLYTQIVIYKFYLLI